MRKRFFVERFDGGRALMEGEAAHHLGRVLRAQPGQVYELSDGTQVWLGRIDVVTRDRVEFALTEQVAAGGDEFEITLLLSVVKFDAFEWALEKATELGVARVVPLGAARSEKALVAAAAKRAERWRRILVESSQQSRRVKVPELEAVRKPEAAFSSTGGELRILLSESPEAATLRDCLDGSSSRDAVLAIGPEGGWTDWEFAAARAAGFREASLGKRILRTETAVVAALAVLNFALGME
jgi:16S rRNA (uracil1498-N3)-methyltransferase